MSERRQFDSLPEHDWELAWRIDYRRCLVG
jgi:hypothetical protein